MERRQDRRFSITLQAVTIADGKSYPTVINNVSMGGVGSSITTLVTADTSFQPSRDIEIIMELPNSEKVSLKCRIAWFLRPPSRENSLMMGLSILEASDSYTEWMAKFA